MSQSAGAGLSVNKMQNGVVQRVLILLLNSIEVVLNIIYFIFSSLYFVLKFSIYYALGINMTESPKKRKRSTNEKPNQTVSLRGVIDANWQKLLSSGRIMDKKPEKPTGNTKEHYTGAVRRSRTRKRKQKKSKDHETVQNDFKSLNLSVNKGTLNSSVPDKGVVKNKDDQSKYRITKYLAIDCEMVGVGYQGLENMLARVSLVNKFGDCIYDKFVKPREAVMDYRTQYSGVRREDLIDGEEFHKVQTEVAELIQGKVLVGHSLANDLDVLYLSHPGRHIRDTSRYLPFRLKSQGGTPSLKLLAKECLGIDIQTGEHDSVEDARAAMQLYCSVESQWEPALSRQRYKKR